MKHIKQSKDICKLILNSKLNLIEEGLIKDYFALKTLEIIKNGNLNQAEAYNDLFRIFEVELFKKKNKIWANFFFTLAHIIDTNATYLNSPNLFGASWKEGFRRNILIKYKIDY